MVVVIVVMSSVVVATRRVSHDDCRVQSAIFVMQFGDWKRVIS